MYEQKTFASLFNEKNGISSFTIVKYLLCLKLVREGGNRNFSHQIVL